MEFDLKLQQFVDWKVYNGISIKKKYGYRVLLIYADGSEVSQQKSGFENAIQLPDDTNTGLCV